MDYVGALRDTPMPTPHGGFLGTLESLVVRLRLRRNEHYRMGFRLYKLARRADKGRFCVLAGTLRQHAAGFILTALGDETDNAEGQFSAERR